VIFTYLLDTNMFSFIVNGASPEARAEFRRLSQDPEARICISSITEAEVRYGMAKRKLSPGRCAAIEGLFANVEILPWGSEEAAAYAQAKAALETQGLGVSLLDFLIGVHAATSASVLVTHDHVFAQIAELTGIPATVDWAKDI
jgi:tRNA(fMet)-specific endonuclease VapC